MSEINAVNEEDLDSLPWQRAYSYVLGREAEYLIDAPSIPDARELLALLEQKLKGLSSDERVKLGNHEYMLVHCTIVRIRTNY